MSLFVDPSGRPGRVTRWWQKLVEDPGETLRRKHLTYEEQVFYEDPPATWSLVLGTWWLWLVLVATVFVVVSSEFRLWRLGVVVLLVAAVILGVKWVRRHYTRYVVTSMRVLRLSGVLTRRVDWMPLSRITDVTFKQNPFERAGGFADVRIVSASEATGLRTLEDVADPVRFHRILTFCVEAKNPNVKLGYWPAAEIH